MASNVVATKSDAKEDEKERTSKERTHFKIGSRKSKLAMVQSEYIMAQLKSMYPTYTFEIVNFDTKGDQILNVALPKIGDKGLFTRELEDGLESGSIDLVVHSLKDMPCQYLPDTLIIAGVPTREDPRDALVLAERWRATRSTLDDLDEGMCVGTSSLRRISQLKMRYPALKFETIRGNLQTRFAKLDDLDEKKFDAIILAAAGLKRMNYENRISQILDPNNVCMHAVSQGALGVECRRDDLVVIEMLNRLNDEETVLCCIAERTLLAALEGGCSAPIAVQSRVTRDSIWLDGAVFDLDGSRYIRDKFEIKFDDSTACPVVNVVAAAAHQAQRAIVATSTASGSGDGGNTSKRKLEFNDDDDDDEESTTKKSKLEKTSEAPKRNYYSFIMDMKIKECRLMKAELCGLHLAEKLKEKGADVLIDEIKAKIHTS